MSLMTPENVAQTDIQSHRVKIGRSTVSYTVETARRRTPYGRLFLFPGLLASKSTYRKAQHHIAQTMDLQVVTLTHSRDFGRLLFNPNRVRKLDCLAVMSDSDRRYGKMAKIIIGHSMGGGDGANVVSAAVKREEQLNIVALALDSSVGLNGRVPHIGNAIEFLTDEVMTADISWSHKDQILNTYQNFLRNPFLAGAEAFVAATSDITGKVAITAEHVEVVELFGGSDRLITPPKDRPNAIVRDGVGHLGICFEPNVGEHAVVEIFERIM